METTTNARLEALIEELAGKFDETDLSGVLAQLGTAEMVELVKSSQHEAIGRAVCSERDLWVRRLAELAQAREQIEYFNGADSMWCPLK